MASSSLAEAALADSHFLATLDAATREQLAPQMQRVQLKLKQQLYVSGRPIEHVYFPITAVISMLAEMDPYSLVEVATIGREGVVGLPLFLGADVTPGVSFAQIPGEAYCMTAEAFRQAVREPSAFTRQLHRYTQSLLMQIAQGNACNRIHPAPERCARWLLLTHDRVDGDDFVLTQEFLAQMLGERRATVNVVASMLQQAGFIRYGRGRVTILDRAGLESASCNCYRVIRQEYDRMLALPGRPGEEGVLRR